MRQMRTLLLKKCTELSKSVDFLQFLPFRPKSNCRNDFKNFPPQLNRTYLSLASEWGITNDPRTKAVAYVVLAPKKAPGKYAKPAKQSA